FDKLLQTKCEDYWAFLARFEKMMPDPYENKGPGEVAEAFTHFLNNQNAEGDKVFSQMFNGLLKNELEDPLFIDAFFRTILNYENFYLTLDDGSIQEGRPLLIPHSLTNIEILFSSHMDCTFSNHSWEQRRALFEQCNFPATKVNIFFMKETVS